MSRTVVPKVRNDITNDFHPNINGNFVYGAICHAVNARVHNGMFNDLTFPYQMTRQEAEETARKIRLAQKSNPEVFVKAATTVKGCFSGEFNVLVEHFARFLEECQGYECV